MTVQYVSPEMLKTMEEQIKKELQGGNNSVGITYNNTEGWYYKTVPFEGGIMIACGQENSSPKDFIPVKIIYNCPATICYFSDGTKEVVKVASDEEYVKEEGVAECIMRKIFKSRHAFLKAVNAGYENEEAEINRLAHNSSL